MYCHRCGAQLNEGALFCGACGTKQNAPSGPAEQPAGQQSPYGRPPVQQPPKKKSKKLLWIAIAAAVVLAIAAVVMFVVLPAMGAGGPLSGNTKQIKFVNDSAKVFTNAFSDFSGGTLEKMAKEPFDLTMDLTSEVNGSEYTGTVEAAYDKQSLGFSAESNGVVTKLLLLEDTLFTDSNGSVSGLSFGSDADLSKPMTLQDRLKAITEGLSNGTVKTKLDYKKLIEMLVNSISPACFESGDGTTTLTLTPDDIIDTIKTFADSLDKDEALKDQLGDFIKEVSGMPVDAVNALETAAQAMEATKGGIDFKIVWEIKYDNGTPDYVGITFSAGEDSYKADFGYVKHEGSGDIVFSLSSQDESVDVSGDFGYEKTDGGIEYNGQIKINGDTLSVSGSEDWSGEKTHGEIKITEPGGGEYSFGYDETLKFAAPKTSVKDDKRFSIDTSDASVTNISDLMSLFGVSGSLMGANTAQPQASYEPVASEAPAPSEAAAGSYQFTLIVPSTDDPYYHQLISTMQAEVAANGGTLEVMATNYDAQLESVYAETLLASGSTDGIIMAPVSGNDTILSIQGKAGDAGVPIVFLCNMDGDVNAVSYDYDTLFSTLAGYCTGNVYIINGATDNAYYGMLEGMFTSALQSNTGASLLSVGYSEYAGGTATTLINDALTTYPDLSTIVCLDQLNQPAVLETLGSSGFTGTLVCYATEGTAIQMIAEDTGSTHVAYGYFSAGDEAQAVLNRMYEMLGGDTEPKVTYLSPYFY